MVVTWLIWLTVGGSALDAGLESLEEYRVKDAVSFLERAQTEGPYSLEALSELYEALGVTYAYLEDDERSMRAFDRLLTLQPSALLPYTLSPQVTFIFEEARRARSSAAQQVLDVSWPRGLATDDEIPVVIDAVRDPLDWFDYAELHWRLDGETQYRVERVRLSPDTTASVTLPGPNTTKDTAVHVFLSAYDERGNEVYRFAHPQTPRSIDLKYLDRPEWYERWWVWTIAGVVAAGATSTVVYFATRPEPESVTATGTIR